MRGRRILGSIGVVVAVVGAGGTVASAGDDDDNGDNAELAEAQFEVFLLTTTEFTPTDITCTRPPMRHATGDLLCYALIASRVSVAAIATLESPGVYRFTPLHKVDPDDLGLAPAPQPPQEPQAPPPESPDAPQQPDTPAPAPAPAPQNATDAAVLDRIDAAVADADGLGEVIQENNDLVTSIDAFAYDAPTATLHVSVTTSAAEPGVRDAIAFSITNILAFLWEEDEPLREPDATIRPSLEVTVDGTTYATPYDVMVRVADYTISQTEWLDIVTRQAAFRRAASR